MRICAFLARYADVLNNRTDKDVFNCKTQHANEPVENYINNVLSLGNKLQLNENNIMAAIKRGLMPTIRLHVLSHNVNNITLLLQQATLAESYQQLFTTPNTLVTAPKVRFNVN
jgi:hypothetical protein